MTQARKLIATELAERLPPTIELLPYSQGVDGLEGPRVMLQLPRIVPEPKAGKHVRTYHAKLLAVAPVADVDQATAEEVDQLAEDCLYALELCSSLVWELAERAVVDDTWAGWVIELHTAPLGPVTTDNQE